jgi:hypothetical protein
MLDRFRRDAALEHQLGSGEPAKGSFQLVLGKSEDGVRHCPKCQAAAAKQWLADRQACSRIQSRFWMAFASIAEWHTPGYFEADNLVSAGVQLEKGRVVHPPVHLFNFSRARCRSLRKPGQRDVQRGHAARCAVGVDRVEHVLQSDLHLGQGCFARSAASVRRRSIRSHVAIACVMPCIMGKFLPFLPSR